VSGWGGPRVLKGLKGGKRTGKGRGNEKKKATRGGYKNRKTKRTEIGKAEKGTFGRGREL